MAQKRVYLDHNATSPIRPAVLEAMIRAMSLPGNASSVHSEGRAAKALLETAREQVAALVNAKARNVYFTAGGTEANNTVLSPRLRIGNAPEAAQRLMISATEHPSVVEGHRFPADQTTTLPVDSLGLLKLDVLEESLAVQEGRTVVSVHMANNETGVIQPIQSIAEIVHRYGGVLHVDAVQAAGRMPLDISALGADILTLSAHKLGGPKGIGAVILASSAVDLGGALIRGGGQERGLRSGTENVAAISGFGVAAEECLKSSLFETERLMGLRQQLQVSILSNAPDAVIIGQAAERLCNTLCAAVPNLRAETLLIAFDLAGVALSSGSACSSGKVKRSKVLEAMGVDHALADGAIRLSLGWNSTPEDCTFFAQACDRVFSNLFNRRNDAALKAG